VSAEIHEYTLLQSSGTPIPFWEGPKARLHSMDKEIKELWIRYEFIIGNIIKAYHIALFLGMHKDY
jgi:hypothetical protein